MVVGEKGVLSNPQEIDEIRKSRVGAVPCNPGGLWRIIVRRS